MSGCYWRAFTSGQQGKVKTGHSEAHLCQDEVLIHLARVQLTRALGRLVRTPACFEGTAWGMTKMGFKTMSNMEADALFLAVSLGFHCLTTTAAQQHGSSARHSTPKLGSL